MKKRAVFIYNGLNPGLNKGPLDQQTNALPLNYITTNMVAINTT